MDLLFDKFIKFCRDRLGNSSGSILKLTIKRYKECSREYQQSRKFVELLQLTESKITCDQPRMFVHLRDFLSILKDNKFRKKKFEHEAYTESSECDSDSTAVLRFKRQQKRELENIDTDSDCSTKFKPKRRKFEVSESETCVSESENEANEADNDRLETNSEHNGEEPVKEQQNEETDCNDKFDTDVNMGKEDEFAESEHSQQIDTNDGRIIELSDKIYDESADSLPDLDNPGYEPSVASESPVTNDNISAVSDEVESNGSFTDQKQFENDTDLKAGNESNVNKDLDGEIFTAEPCYSSENEQNCSNEDVSKDTNALQDDQYKTQIGGENESTSIDKNIEEFAATKTEQDIVSFAKKDSTRELSKKSRDKCQSENNSPSKEASDDLNSSVEIISDGEGTKTVELSDHEAIHVELNEDCTSSDTEKGHLNKSTNLSKGPFDSPVKIPDSCSDTEVTIIEDDVVSAIHKEPKDKDKHNSSTHVGPHSKVSSKNPKPNKDTCYDVTIIDSDSDHKSSGIKIKITKSPKVSPECELDSPLSSAKESDSEPESNVNARRSLNFPYTSEDEDPEEAKKAKKFREKCKKKYVVSVGKKKNVKQDKKQEIKPTKFSERRSYGKSPKSRKRSNSGHDFSLSPRDKRHSGGSSPKKKSSPKSPKKSPIVIVTESSESDNEMEEFNKKFKTKQDNMFKKMFNIDDDPIIMVKKVDTKQEHAGIESDSGSVKCENDKDKIKEEMDIEFDIEKSENPLSPMVTHNKEVERDFETGIHGLSKKDSKENTDPETKPSSNLVKKRATLTTLEYFGKNEQKTIIADEYTKQTKSFHSDSDDHKTDDTVNDKGTKLEMKCTDNEKHCSKLERDSDSSAGPSARNSFAGPNARDSTAGPSARNSTAGPSARDSTAGPRARDDRQGPSARGDSPGPSTHKDGDATPPPKNKGSTKQIRRLEAVLEQIRNQIEKVRTRELSLDELDSEISDYILEDKLQKKFVKVWKKLCELHKAVEYTGRPTEKYFRYQGTRYPDVNRKIERFINKKKIFPDYNDIRELITKVNKDKRLNLRVRDIDYLAREAFTDVGNQLQKRRQKDFVSNLNIPGPEVNTFSVYDDPALFDTELKKKLDANKKTARSKMSQVVEKYAHLQHEKGDNTDDGGDDEEEEEKDETEDIDITVDTSDIDDDQIEISVRARRSETMVKGMGSDIPIEKRDNSHGTTNIADMDPKSSHFSEVLGLQRTPRKIETMSLVPETQVTESVVSHSKVELPDHSNESLKITILSDDDDDNANTDYRNDPVNNENTDYNRDDSVNINIETVAESDASLNKSDDLMAIGHHSDTSYLSEPPVDSDRERVPSITILTDEDDSAIALNIFDNKTSPEHSDASESVDISLKEQVDKLVAKINTVDGMAEKLNNDITKITTSPTKLEKETDISKNIVQQKDSEDCVTIITDDEDDAPLELKIVSARHVSEEDLSKLHTSMDSSPNTNNKSPVLKMSPDHKTLSTNQNQSSPQLQKAASVHISPEQQKSPALQISPDIKSSPAKQVSLAIAKLPGQPASPAIRQLFQTSPEVRKLPNESHTSANMKSSGNVTSSPIKLKEPQLKQISPQGNKSQLHIGQEITPGAFKLIKQKPQVDSSICLGENQTAKRFTNPITSQCEVGKSSPIGKGVNRFRPLGDDFVKGYESKTVESNKFTWKTSVFNIKSDSLTQVTGSRVTKNVPVSPAKLSPSKTIPVTPSSTRKNVQFSIASSLVASQGAQVSPSKFSSSATNYASGVSPSKSSSNYASSLLPSKSSSSPTNYAYGVSQSKYSSSATKYASGVSPRKYSSSATNYTSGTPNYDAALVLRGIRKIAPTSYPKSIQMSPVRHTSTVSGANSNRTLSDCLNPRNASNYPPLTLSSGKKCSPTSSIRDSQSYTPGNMSGATSGAFINSPKKGPILGRNQSNLSVTTNKSSAGGYSSGRLLGDSGNTSTNIPSSQQKTSASDVIVIDFDSANGKNMKNDKKVCTDQNTEVILLDDDDDKNVTTAKDVIVLDDDLPTKSETNVAAKRKDKENTTAVQHKRRDKTTPGSGDKIKKSHNIPKSVSPTNALVKSANSDSNTTKDKSVSSLSPSQCITKAGSPIKQADGGQKINTKCEVSANNCSNSSNSCKGPSSETNSVVTSAKTCPKEVTDKHTGIVDDDSASKTDPCSHTENLSSIPDIFEGADSLDENQASEAIELCPISDIFDQEDDAKMLDEQNEHFVKSFIESPVKKQTEQTRNVAAAPQQPGNSKGVQKQCKESFKWTQCTEGAQKPCKDSLKWMQCTEGVNKKPTSGNVKDTQSNVDNKRSQGKESPTSSTSPKSHKQSEKPVSSKLAKYIQFSNPKYEATSEKKIRTDRNFSDKNKTALGKSESTSSRHKSDSTSGRHKTDSTSGRHKTDSTSGRHKTDSTSGRHKTDSTSGRHKTDSTSGRHGEEEITSTSADHEHMNTVKVKLKDPNVLNKLEMLKTVLQANSKPKQKPQDNRKQNINMTTVKRRKVSGESFRVKDENAGLIETYQEPDSTPYHLEDTTISSSRHAVIVLSDSE